MSAATVPAGTSDDVPWDGIHAAVDPDARRPAANVRPTSWRPVDLSAVLAAGYEPPRPTVGRRSDGRGILYRGRSHSLTGESEAGKSWVSQHLGVQELDAGQAVIYLDFEDDAGSVAARFLTLGCYRERLTSHFAYISPHEPLSSPGALDELRAAVRDLRPSLVILDGVTEALSLHGLSSLDNDDVARFGRMLTRPLTEAGAAVLSLDHVTKDRENRGRYAIGGVHKLNGLNGAAFTLENVQRFGDRLPGRSRLLIAKDRPGQLRPHALPGAGDRWWYADFTLNTAEAMPAELVAPVEHTEPFRPTVLMAKVSAAIIAAPHPLSSNDVAARVTGKATAIRTALAALVDEGYVLVTEGPRHSRLHSPIKPFAEGDRS